MGGWLGSRAGLDAVIEKIDYFPWWELNPGHPTRSIVSILTELNLVPVYTTLWQIAESNFNRVETFVQKFLYL
jgi:hypothetical protein